MEQENKFSEELWNMTAEAVANAIERVWPWFFRDLEGYPGPLAIKVAVCKTGRDCGKTQVQSISWLPKPKVIDKGYPEFEVGGKQMTIDFGEKQPETAMQAAAAEPLLEGIEEKLKPLLRAAEDMGEPLFCPCQHEDTPPGARFDRWENGKCTSCSPIPESKMDECVAAMEKGGVVLLHFGPNELRLSMASAKKLQDFGYEVWERYSRSIERWRILGEDEWHTPTKPMTWADGRVPFQIFI